eukprot:3939777-Rhodomonas_salina.2
MARSRAEPSESHTTLSRSRSQLSLAHSRSRTLLAHTNHLSFWRTTSRSTSSLTFALSHNVSSHTQSLVQSQRAAAPALKHFARRGSEPQAGGSQPSSLSGALGTLGTSLRTSSPAL